MADDAGRTERIRRYLKGNPEFANAGAYRAKVTTVIDDDGVEHYIVDPDETVLWPRIEEGDD